MTKCKLCTKIITNRKTHAIYCIRCSEIVEYIRTAIQSRKQNLVREFSEENIKIKINMEITKK